MDKSSPSPTPPTGNSPNPSVTDRRDEAASPSDEALSLPRKRELPTKIIVGTHHKTGTVLMQNIFSELAKRQELRFHNCSRHGAPTDTTKADILFDWHSKFPGLPLHALSDVKGIHIIRDPRLVVISAALYHVRCPTSSF